MIKTLIFDLDDTLYNERNYVFGAFAEVAKFLSYKYKLNEKKLYEDIIDIFEKNGRGKIFDILCEKYKINENIKTLVDVYRNSQPELKLYDDGLQILKYGKKNKFNLALITDGCSKVQWNKIKSLKLENIIDKIIVTDDLGKEYWKPHEKSYLEIIKYFNCNSGECVYIGDNPNKDFIGAKKLGLKTIRIIRAEGDHMKTFLTDEYEADFNIQSLMEVINII